MPERDLLVAFIGASSPLQSVNMDTLYAKENDILKIQMHSYIWLDACYILDNSIF